MKEIAQIASAIDGWMYDDELEWLAKTAATKKIIIEIGSWKGKSTKALALATPGVVYAVDHWLGSASEQATFHKEAIDKGPNAMFEIFKNNLLDEIKCGKVIPVMMESGLAAHCLKQTLRNNLADMIFIDADHTYESVARDISNYLPLLKVGGTICGHDYSDAFPGVMEAVNKLVPDSKVEVGSIWTALKK